jgi:hypothetical protein
VFISKSSSALDFFLFGVELGDGEESLRSSYNVAWLFSKCLSPVGEDFFLVKMLNFRSIMADIFRVAPEDELR